MIPPGNYFRKTRKSFLMLWFTILLISGSLLGSCVSKSLANQLEKGNINEDNCQLLEGTYSNLANKDSQLITHMLQFWGRRKYRKYDSKKDSLEIRIHDVKLNSLKISVLNDGKVIKTVVYHGEYINGYFYGESRFGNGSRFILKFPLGPILWGVENYGFCFGISKENKLFVHGARCGIVFITIMPGYVKCSEKGNEFPKLKENQ